MKVLLLALAMATAMQATPISSVCPPTPATDTIAISPGCGLDPLVASPGRAFWWGFNDNPVWLPGNDHDFCDICGTLLVSSDGTSALLTYTGQAASSHLTMYYGATPLFSNFGTPPGATAVIATTPNAAILFSLHVIFIHGGTYDFSSTDRDYFRDGCLENCGGGIGEPNVPELATMLTGGMGLCLLGLARRRRSR